MKDWGVETEELRDKLRNIYIPETARIVSFLMKAILAVKSSPKKIEKTCKSIEELLININIKNTDTDGNSFVFKNWYEYFLFLIQWVYPYLPKEKQEQIITKFLAGLNNIVPNKFTKINDNNISGIIGRLKSGQPLFTIAEDGQYHSFTETTNQAEFKIKSKTKLPLTEQSKDVFFSSSLKKPFIFLYSTTKKAMSFVATKPFSFLYDNIIKPTIINPIVFLIKATTSKNKTGTIAEGKENKIIDRISIGIDSSTGIDIKDGTANKGINSKANIILTQNTKKDNDQNMDLLANKNGLLINEKKEDKPDSEQTQEDKKTKEKQTKQEKEQNNHNIEKNNTDSQYQNENLVANRIVEQQEDGGTDFLEQSSNEDLIVSASIKSKNTKENQLDEGDPFAGMEYSFDEGEVREKEIFEENIERNLIQTTPETTNTTININQEEQEDISTSLAQQSTSIKQVKTERSDKEQPKEKEQDKEQSKEEIFHSLEKINKEVDRKDKNGIKSILSQEGSDGKGRSV